MILNHPFWGGTPLFLVQHPHAIWGGKTRSHKFARLGLCEYIGNENAIPLYHVPRDPGSPKLRMVI